MAKKAKRQKAIKRLNLSDHTLDINIRRCNYNKFNFSDIEDFVREVVGSRDYQYDAIKQIMIYLWGGSYKSITELGKENYTEKLQIKQRFGTEENFLHQLPLPDRLSGVVHMATGTGKSYVIFAIAYLSLVMGFTKRVLVLGPSSTIIEQGLREKFSELKNKIEFNNKLSQRYRGKAIHLLTDNDPIEDDSIVIENINAVYTFGGITDTLFKNTTEVLVLGDEIHHAYRKRYVPYLFVID
jgi:type III restriction enzyme